ncbi:MAG: tRNA glutamyl-Q(34) synthetase GluQRS [Porticoccus sp.]|nr:tRNA glutamyl-Q(34) synthetase GluQRS [Porticoccus sp.]
MPVAIKPGSSACHYVGRFAPSPTGPLHFGSLVSAVASYLDAKANKGEWLVRIEDIDPPRESSGSSDKILRQLQEHGLQWDREVLYQSHRTEAYLSALKTLKRSGLIFSCHCSRQQLKEYAATHSYPCPPTSSSTLSSLRLLAEDNKIIIFDDIFQGQQRQSIKEEVGDMVLCRKDGLYAYQLAVVIDDCFQKITHVIRGSDLLESTPRQIYLQNLLKFPTPTYGHVPIAVDKEGRKLSKQNLAPSLGCQAATKNLTNAISWLGLSLPDKLSKTNHCDELLAWATTHWNHDKVPRMQQNQNPDNLK